MTFRKTVMLAAVVAALSGATAAVAVEEKAPAKEGAPAETALPEKAKKVKPHDHASFHKSGVETERVARSSDAKAPAHDHQKFHK
jgi:hypothetical protein